MLHIPIKTEDQRNTDIRVIFGSLSSGIHLLCRDLVFTYNSNSLLVIRRKLDDIGRNTIVPSQTHTDIDQVIFDISPVHFSLVIAFSI